MRAVITGLTGFIGSHLAESLAQQGHDVLGLGRTDRWRADTPAIVQQRCQLHSWDLRHPISVTTQHTLQDFAPDAVFHFAGISIPAQCGRLDPTPDALAVNVGGTRHLIGSIAKLPSSPKLVFTSSCHVYQAVSSSNPYVTESAPIDPVSAYGKTKLQCEELIREYDPSRACIVRGFHHVGPRQPAGLMLTDWLDQLSDPECLQLRVKSTNSYLDMVDVRDAVEAYELLATDETASGVYNLGSGRISRSGEVLQAILDVMDRQVDVVEESADERWNPIADIQQLKSIGWSPSRDYRDSIRAMVQAG